MRDVLARAASIVVTACANVDTHEGDSSARPQGRDSRTGKPTVTFFRRNTIMAHRHIGTWLSIAVLTSPFVWASCGGGDSNVLTGGAPGATGSSSTGQGSGGSSTTSGSGTAGSSSTTGTSTT